MPAEVAGDLGSRIRLVMYGRILRSHEVLMTVLEAELDRSSLSLSVFVSPVAEPASSADPAMVRTSAKSTLSADEALDIFEALDTNADGEISMIEFIKGLRASPDIAQRLELPTQIHQEDESRSIFQYTFGEIDVDLSKSVSRDEFVRYYARAPSSAGDP